MLFISKSLIPENGTIITHHNFKTESRNTCVITWFINYVTCETIVGCTKNNFNRSFTFS